MSILKRAVTAAGLAAAAWMLAGAPASAHVDGSGRASHNLGAPSEPETGNFHYVEPADAGAKPLWVGGADGNGLCWILREVPALDRSDSDDLMISTVDGEVVTWPGDGWAFEDCAPAGTYTLCGTAVAVGTMAAGHTETVSVTLYSSPNNRGQRNSRTVSVTLTASGNVRGAGAANWTASGGSPNCGSPAPPADVPSANPPSNNPPLNNPPGGGTPSCPSGQELVNGVCKAKCGQGYKRGTDGKCWRDWSACNPGYERVNGVCVAKCKAGEQRVNGVCQAPGSTPPGTTPSCPSGQELVNGQCVAVCTGGRSRVNGTCQCPAGQQWDGTRCKSSANPVVPCTGGQVPVNGICQCPSGQELVNGQCVAVCTGGRVRDTDGSCKCPSGQEWKNGSCQAKRSQCQILKDNGPQGWCAGEWTWQNQETRCGGVDDCWEVPCGWVCDFSPYDPV